jgi:hypothetical protein
MRAQAKNTADRQKKWPGRKRPDRFMHSLQNNQRINI